MVLWAVAAMVGCTPDLPSETPVAGRWYSVEQVEEGRLLFLTHCATCHGDNAEGTTEWRKTDVNGNYPPPPLNGTAHAWHHPLQVLERTIANGGVPLGGVMPAFGNTLSVDDVRATISYFQSFWPDDTYGRWEAINNR